MRAAYIAAAVAVASVLPVAVTASATSHKPAPCTQRAQAKGTPTFYLRAIDFGRVMVDVVPHAPDYWRIQYRLDSGQLAEQVGGPPGSFENYVITGMARSVEISAAWGLCGHAKWAPTQRFDLTGVISSSSASSSGSSASSSSWTSSSRSATTSSSQCPPVPTMASTSYLCR
jgi:hypothetical protein